MYVHVCHPGHVLYNSFLCECEAHRVLTRELSSLIYYICVQKVPPLLFFFFESAVYQSLTGVLMVDDFVFNILRTLLLLPCIRESGCKVPPDVGIST